LHNAVDRGGDELKRAASIGLDDILSQAGRLLLGLCQIVEQCAAIFGIGLIARLCDRCDGRIRLAEATFLNFELLLLLDKGLKRLQIEYLGAGLMLIEGLTDLGLLLEQRNELGDLSDGSGAGGALSLLLRLLAIEGRELRAMLGRLVQEKAALRRDQRCARALRRLETGQRIGTVCQRCAQSCDIELCGDEVPVKMLPLGVADRRIELNEEIALPD